MRDIKRRRLSAHEAAIEPDLFFQVLRERQWVILQFVLGHANGHRDHRSIRLLAADHVGKSDEEIVASQRQQFSRWHERHAPAHRERLRMRRDESWRRRLRHRWSARTAARFQRRRNRKMHRAP